MTELLQNEGEFLVRSTTEKTAILGYLYISVFYGGNVQHFLIYSDKVRVFIISLRNQSDSVPYQLLVMAPLTVAYSVVFGRSKSVFCKHGLRNAYAFFRLQRGSILVYKNFKKLTIKPTYVL